MQRVSNPRTRRVNYSQDEKEIRANTSDLLDVLKSEPEQELERIDFENGLNDRKQCLVTAYVREIFDYLRNNEVEFLFISFQQLELTSK